MFEVGHDIFKHGSNDVKSAHNSKGRMAVVLGFFCTLFVLFVVKTLFLGFAGSDENRARASGDWNVSRADIVDRNGTDILAKNIASCDVALVPSRLAEKNKERAAQLLHEVLPYKYSLADAVNLVQNTTRYKLLAKNLPDGQCKPLRAARIDGLDVKRVQMRKYPKHRLFSHVVGFVGEDGHGLEGAERIFDDYLDENIDPLRLSLDTRIQMAFYEQLSIAMQKYEAKGAMGLLMNSRTGEMLAMVSLPDFDPENRNLDPESNHLFKPLRGVFEMGSVFKIFNTAMAMENHINKKYVINKPYPILDRRGRVATRITDVATFRPKTPTMSVEEIMLHSCNVGSAQIALDLPDGTQEEFFHRLHLDEKLDLEFGKTEKPLMPRKWGPVERATVSFGHGISVTPMHLLLAVNAMTNGGIYIYPTLQKRSIGAVRGERVLDEEISAKLREIMFGVVEETSGRNARVPGFKIGGKTGTAEKYISGTNDKKRNQTAFVGIFPADAPQYILLVILDEPKGIKETWNLRTSAWNAVPTAGKIMSRILPLLFE
ncbi:MAG: penicillin-binding protein 2 [Alphaproteobacteria bacterium]|nr:penicillin-binding protein 2 [Alphaproteobacteria bacterium]